PGRARKHRPRARTRLGAGSWALRTSHRWSRELENSLASGLGLDEGGDPVVQLVGPVEAAVAAGDDRDLGVWHVAGPSLGLGPGDVGAGRAPVISRTGTVIARSSSSVRTSGNFGCAR